MAEPTPIAFGITELNVGGAEKSLVELVTRLDRNKWRPTVVTLESATGPLVERLKAAGIAVESLEIKSGWDVRRGLFRWAKILRRERPKILVTFLFHANLLGRFAGWWANVPKHVSSVRVAERGARWHLTLDRLSKSWTTKYACVNRTVATHTQKQLRLPEDRTVVLPNGVDLEKKASAKPVDASSWGIQPTDRVLLSVGRLCEQKGTDLAVKAFALARQKGLDDAFKLVLVGEGPMRTAIEKLAKELGVIDRVVFAGFQADVWSWLARSEALVLSSRWEGMPNVVLEAMAMGLLVIGSTVDGTSELILDGETGWLADDLESMAEAIVEMASNPQESLERGLAGRKHAEQHYSFKQMVVRWDSFLSEMAGSI